MTERTRAANQDLLQEAADEEEEEGMVVLKASLTAAVVACKSTFLRGADMVDIIGFKENEEPVLAKPNIRRARNTFIIFGGRCKYK